MVRDLESEATEIEINGQPVKIIEFTGKVSGRVVGLQDDERGKFLQFPIESDILYGESWRNDVSTLRFFGSSPLRGGDNIRTGLIYDENFSTKEKTEGEVVYIEIYGLKGYRLDFANGYRLTPRDFSKLGLTE